MDENSRKSKVTTRVKDEFHVLLNLQKLRAVVQYRPKSGARQGHSSEKFVQRVPHSRKCLSGIKKVILTFVCNPEGD